MKTKIVFSVVSGKEGVYLSQAMIAAYTCRHHNPDATILLVVDQDTATVIDEEWSNLKKYVSEVVVVDTPKGYSNMLKSRFLKTTLRQNIEGDFLFIDTDTVIAESLASADDIKEDICAVLDLHSLVSELPVKPYERTISFAGLKLSDLRNKYFNSGVMYVKDSLMSHRLFDLWHKYWEESLTNGTGVDQPALARANKECGYPIAELDGIWNCQVAEGFVNYLSKAKILHYFACYGEIPYRLSDASVFESVRGCGDIPQWLAKELEEPKSLFCKHHRVVYGEDAELARTYVREMYVRHRWLFNIFEYISRSAVICHKWLFSIFK